MTQQQITPTTPRQAHRPSDSEGWSLSHEPFGLTRWLASDVDRLFDKFSAFADRYSTRVYQPWRPTPATYTGERLDFWIPDVDMFERNHDLVIRVDLPGLVKDDIDIQMTETGVNIQGERRRERQSVEGVYRTERRFGRFDRYIPLPEGAFTEQALAIFQDGILEIVMPAPPKHVMEGHRLEIREPTKH